MPVEENAVNYCASYYSNTLEMFGTLIISIALLLALSWQYSLAVVPVINNLPNSTTIHEDTSTEILLYTIDVTDADGDSITCSIGPGTNPGTGTTRFQVRYIGGTLTWGLYTVAGINYDYISEADYSLEVDCDANGDTVTGTYIVYLTPNQAPVIQNLPNNTILSTSAAVGHNVFTVIADDAESDQISFSITCNPAAPPCPFKIFDSGALQLIADISATTVTGYDVTVSVSDNSGSGTPKILTVTFSDINDQPAIQNLGTSISVPENSALGNSLVTTTCTDSDVADTLVYSMTCAPLSGSTYFQINSSSGQIATSSSSLINYEFLLAVGITSFSCTVTCSDGQATDTATVDFDVTDETEAPAFSQNAYSISADEGPGGTVLLTTAYVVADEDAGDTRTFSFNCGTSTQYFAMNTSTGIISYSTYYDVDDGIRPALVNCNVTVTDSTGLTDIATQTIAINNINDNAPVFSKTAYVWFISEVDPVGTTLGIAAAADADIGTYGDIIYSLDQSALTAEYFEIDQAGLVKIKNSISSIGAGVTTVFYALATDGGGNETRVTVTVVIAATTTTTTTTTTDRYKTFFDDGRNIAWFTAVCVLLAISAVMSGWMCFSFSGGAPMTGESVSGYSKFTCCRCWHEPIKPRRNWGEGHRDYFKRQLPSPSPAPRQHADFQFWSESYKQLD